MFWVYGCLAFLGVLLTSQVSEKKEIRRFFPSIEAANLSLWHEAAVLYARAHPEAQGLITADSLRLPPGYRALGNWKTVYEQGVVTTWAVSEEGGVSPDVLAHALADRAAHRGEAGIVTQGKIRTEKGSKISATLHVPEGVAAFMTRVAP